jgi:hypothetical protein
VYWQAVQAQKIKVQEAQKVIKVRTGVFALLIIILKNLF